jgi:hypothetical protein
MIQKSGPQAGENATKYFNVQGKARGEDGKYACFGVLDFKLSKPAGKAEKVKALTLTLVQSVPRFANDGKIRFYLTGDTAAEITPREGSASPALKFDAASADGVGDQLKPRYPIGSGSFKTAETGRVDTFTLTLDADAQACLTEQREKGGTIRVVVVPDSDDVAATYAGATHPNEAIRPRLALDATAAK